ncbi:hypothetical protein EZI54_23895 [Marinobacter halodurans]|uniref:Transposase n=1 Tax=Marinobacter halodurans TaxID=2528979 RepID=A0ABY1ZD16_9GAMM|nr:transposase [Marinobacter halodurans]TBW44107.1 hypothetical protein EZI54_23895 [Marinobacter halodurans]
MPRPQRLEYEGAFYHVMNRGRRRQKVFHGPSDYEDFLRTLSEAHERFGLEIHAYCLMGNHYHLLVKTPRGNLSRCMRHVNGLYTQRYNRRAGTDGPLFRGRFKAILVDADAYLLQLTRYIHRNPIETSEPLVERLEDYPWSSYPVYVNRARAPDWLYRETTYTMLGHRHRYAQYRAYVEQGTDTDLRAFYEKGRLPPVLGSESFKAEIEDEPWENVSPEKLRQQLYEPVAHETIIETVARLFDVEPRELRTGKRGQRNPARWLAMVLCQQLGGLSQSRVAEIFQLGSVGGISHARRQLEKAIEDDVELRNRWQLAIKHLTP